MRVFKFRVEINSQKNKMINAIKGNDKGKKKKEEKINGVKGKRKREVKGKDEGRK